MRQCFVLASLLCLISACSKDNKEPKRKFISLQLDGLVILAENPSAAITAGNLTDADPNNDFPVLKITGAGNSDETINFSLISESEPFKKGSYLSTQQGNGMSITFSDSAYTVLADNSNGYMSLNITEVQDSLIEGDFSGLLADTSGTIALKTVTHGSFRAIITKN
ncbi:hypothetical protein GO495_30480 [Chitinophaga oryziterrae]|uniref:Uncharacterized protein n=1 Tax=Chitinophaga oryziterrae TaxID=1031224 RepID=A0A6N8JKQ1_9BACT|nr:hypothetical protein [Chitinophaga oryziterrae]MVT44956.1 hypothetical protein [Chitinophaga oryziterrae]